MHTVGEVGLGRTGMPGRGLSSVLGGQEQPLRRTAREPGSGYEHTVQLSRRLVLCTLRSHRELCVLCVLCVLCAALPSSGIGNNGSRTSRVVVR